MEFSDRSYTLPERHSVPKTKFMPESDTKSTGSKRKGQKRIENPIFKNVKDWSHTKSLTLLARNTEVFFRPEVWHDRQLLARIFYRNRNQHKNSVYFRKLYELRRALKILERVQLREMVEKAMEAFYDAGTARHARKPTAWQALPCQHFMTALAGRLANVAKLIAKLVAICRDVYTQFTAQMSQTLFMPLAMVIQGISARLHMVFDIWHKDLVATYTDLLEWLPNLPACPDSLSGKTNLLAAKLPHPNELARHTLSIAESQLVTEMNKAARSSAPEPDTAISDKRGQPILGKRHSSDIDTQEKHKGNKRAKKRVLDLYADDDLGGEYCEGSLEFCAPHAL
ncbi:hypothetical protein GGI12_002420 [Dipsacomyces acuminosporus]|nr:hypothetical protein GGI12_002420 [Dipsacomyces acuminosporus]